MKIQYRSEISELRICSPYAHTRMTIRVYTYDHTRIHIRVYVVLCYSPLTVSFVKYCWTKQYIALLGKLKMRELFDYSQICIL